MVIEVKQNGKFVKIPYITADVPVSEAPIDGKQYARQDATWSEIVIPEVDLTEVETNIAANTQAIAANTADIATLNSTVSNLPTAGSIVVTTDPRLTAATTTKAGLMSAADKVQLDSTLTATEIENKVNAAVSSVYRVKGNVATVSNLPTSNVAIGDVYNITDSGANYVAVNNNPVEWDKLSETVDLAPYMQTSTANSTFVKKSGDTMTGSLYLSNGILTFEGDADRIISVRAKQVGSNQRPGLHFFARDGSTKLGVIGASYNSADPTDFELNMGWGSNPYLYTNSLSVSNNHFKYKNIDVVLADDSKAITIHANSGSNNRAYLASNGITIIPTSSNNATGFIWKNQANTATLLHMGAFTNGDSKTNYCFMGWGTTPWNSNNNLSVGADRLTYKNERIWHAGNDGAGSGLDADTVDGIQSNRIIYGDNSTGTVNVGITGNKDNKADTITKSGFYRCNNDTKFTDMVIHCNHSTGPSHAFQLGTGYEPTGSLYYRIKSDNVWGATRKVVDTSTVLTQAEYNALGSTVNSDGKIYFIKE